MFAFMGDTIMENGRHLGIFKNAAGLSNIFVVLTRMAYSSTVIFWIYYSLFSIEDQSSVISWHLKYSVEIIIKKNTQMGSNEQNFMVSASISILQQEDK